MRPGQRVIVSLTPVCGTCWFCRRQETHLCEMGPEVMARPTRRARRRVGGERHERGRQLRRRHDRRRGVVHPGRHGSPGRSTRAHRMRVHDRLWRRDQHRAGGCGRHGCRDRLRWRGHLRDPGRASCRRVAHHRDRSRGDEAPVGPAVRCDRRGRPERGRPGGAGEGPHRWSRRGLRLRGGGCRATAAAGARDDSTRRHHRAGRRRRTRRGSRAPDVADGAWRTAP